MSLQECLKELGASQPLIDKSEKLGRLAELICPEKISDFFMSETTKTDKQRIFDSLWFFSPKYVLESKRVMSTELNIDICCLYRSIDRCEITYLDFDPFQPEKTTDTSSVRIEGFIGESIIIFKASGSNCRKLWKILAKHLLPNIVEFVEIQKEK